jgi:hypothetical protein
MQQLPANVSWENSRANKVEFEENLCEYNPLRHNAKTLPRPYYPASMTRRRTIKFALLFALLPASVSQNLRAQDHAPIPGLKPEAATPAAPAPGASLAAKGEHRFWDQTNDWLFAGVAASRTLDYFSTLNMRRRGRQEILLTNDVVDNHAAFAAIEAAGTATSIGVSYLFHRCGHHKLERWTSIIHIGLTSTGAVRNYCLKTAHPAAAKSP